MFGALPFFELGPWNLGPLTIHAFGVFVALGVILAERLAMRRAAQLGIDAKVMSSALGHMLLCGFIGGHVFGVLFYQPRQVLEDPLSLLRIWEMQSSYAGILGALIGLAIFALRRSSDPSQSILRIADAAAFALPVGWLFGRIGCAFAHDHPGRLTDFFLAVDFGARAPGGVRHDLGFEEAFWWVAIVAGFQLLDRLRPELRQRPGFYPGLLCLAYAPARFFLEFLRATDARYLGLTPAQYASLAALALGLFLIRGRTLAARPDYEPRGSW